MTTEFWIEKAWGDSVENATIADIKVAIQEILKMDDEHGGFWVGNNENEFVMEIHKDLKLFFVANDKPDEQITAKLNSWAEAEKFYQLFLDNRYEQIEEEIRTK